jgi:hypothetical protein
MGFASLCALKTTPQASYYRVGDYTLSYGTVYFLSQQLSVFVSLFAASVFINLIQICDLAWTRRRVGPSVGAAPASRRRRYAVGLQVTEGGCE